MHLRRFGDEAYRQHDARGDALASDELFLAQLAHMPQDKTLSTLVSLCAHNKTNVALPSIGDFV